MDENKKDIKGFAVGLILTIAILGVICIVLICSVIVLKQAEENDNAGEEYSTPVVTPKPEEPKNEVEKPEAKPISQTSDEIAVVPTLLDEIATNSAWCGTFQLVWNDMQNEVVKKDVEFDPQIPMVDNLNKQSFKESDISEEYFYKIWGLKTLKLKEEIEKGIKDKFNQESDVLDLLDWSDTPEDDSGYQGDYSRYLFYTMLYREFNFENPFTVLDNGAFEGTGKTYENVEYFGIDEDTEKAVYDQIYVLYYNSEEDFAVILNTKEGDQVLLAKGNNGNTFKGIYDEVMAKSQSYTGNRNFTDNDSFKAPKIKFNLLREYTEFENKPFYSADGYECEIAKALQTIKFELDNKGGKIKSEAVIDMKLNSAVMEEPEEHRYFNFNGTYTMFLLENGKDLPYFAANIDDVTLYQEQGL